MPSRHALTELAAQRKNKTFIATAKEANIALNAIESGHVENLLFISLL